MRKHDCENGDILPLCSMENEDGVTVLMNFNEYEAFFVEMFTKITIIPKEWTIVYNGKSFNKKKLEDWKNYGADDFCGYVSYETEVEISDASRAEIQLEEVYHIAKLYVNDRYADIKMWQPYFFDITDYIVQGKNKIRIECGNLFSNNLKHYESKMRWQIGIHRKNPIDSYKNGIYGKVKIVLY